MWVPLDPGIVTQEARILVLGAEVHLQGEEASDPQLPDLWIAGDEVVEDVTPAAPLPTDNKNDSLVLLLCLLDQTLKIATRIAPRILAEARLGAGGLKLHDGHQC